MQNPFAMLLFLVRKWGPWCLQEKRDEESPVVAKGRKRRRPRRTHATEMKSQEDLAGSRQRRAETLPISPLCPSRSPYLVTIKKEKEGARLFSAVLAPHGCPRISILWWRQLSFHALFSSPRSFFHFGWARCKEQECNAGHLLHHLHLDLDLPRQGHSRHLRPHLPASRPLSPRHVFSGRPLRRRVRRPRLRRRVHAAHHRRRPRRHQVQDGLGDRQQ